MQAEVVNRKSAFLRVKELHFHKIGRPFKLFIRCKTPHGTAQTAFLNPTRAILLLVPRLRVLKLL